MPDPTHEDVSLLRDGPTHDLFEAMARGELPVATCRDCGHVSAATRPHCPRCGGTERDLTPSSGRGRVVAGTLTRDREGHVLTAPALVELDDGPRLYGGLIDARSHRGGARVRVEFARSREGEAYPVFAPEDDDEGVSP